MPVRSLGVVFYSARSGRKTARTMNPPQIAAIANRKVAFDCIVI